MNVIAVTQAGSPAMHRASMHSASSSSCISLNGSSYTHAAIGGELLPRAYTSVTLDARFWMRSKLNARRELAAKLSGRRIGEVQAQKVDCSASLSPFIHLQMPSASPLMVAAPSARVAYAHVYKN